MLCGDYYGTALYLHREYLDPRSVIYNPKKKEFDDTASSLLYYKISWDGMIEIPFIL